MLFKIIKAFLNSTIGKLSQEDKEKLKTFIEEAIKAAAAGAVQGAMKK